MREWRDGPFPNTLLVTIDTKADRSQPVDVLVFCPGGQCPAIQQGWSLVADGLRHDQKDGDNWSWATDSLWIGPPKP
ncbi:MAG: hypothetical protein IT307_01090 [Chloroflexi bacterium]|nr:hypothetical protein [Chloroflexota bacterium]